MTDRESPALSLFEAALGERWHRLPPAVRRLHSFRNGEIFSGRAQVTRGRGLVARLLAWLFGFPTAGDGIPVTVTMTRTATGETWERSFAGRRFRSYLSRSPLLYRTRERFLAFICELELPVENERLSFLVRRGWLLGAPLPHFMLPQSRSREFAVNDCFHFDVGLFAPITGALIVRYQGQLVPANPRAALDRREDKHASSPAT